MVALPSDWTTAGTPKNLAARTKLELIRGFVAQLPGGNMLESLTISAGVVTPTGSLLEVDVESGTTDDLNTIATTNLPAGSVIRVRSTDASREIVLTQAGNLLLRDGKSVALRTPKHFVDLARIGSSWIEVGRNVGNALRTVRALTANTTLVETDSGSIITNTGAAGDLEHTLPAATIGMSLSVRVTAAFKVKLTSVGTDTIRDAAGISAGPGGTEIAAVIGNYFEIECHQAGKWVVTTSRGTLATA